MLNEDRTLSLKEYIFQGCVRNHCYMDAWYKHPELGRGFQVMMRIRVGAWEPASRLKKNGCVLLLEGGILVRVECVGVGRG